MLNQSAFAEQVISRFRMQDANPVGTPLDVSVKLQKATDNDISDASLQTHFRQIIGSIMYLMIGTRPDLAATISIVSQYAAKPTQIHLNAAKRVLRYLKGSANYELCLGANPRNTTNSSVELFDNKINNNTDSSIETFDKTLRLYGFSDASWGNDVDTRKSTTGYVFFLSDGVISWGSKKQSTVALSTTEAEYMALTETTKEAIWLRRILSELGFTRQEPTVVYEDNQSAIALANNPVHHGRTKHIDIKYHFVRNRVESQEIRVEYVPTDEMVADALTKPLSGPTFAKLVERMNLRYVKWPKT